MFQTDHLAEEYRLGDRTIRELVTDLETMGLVETWIESRGREGRVKQVETTLTPQWVRDCISAYLDATEQVTQEALLTE